MSSCAIYVPTPAMNPKKAIHAIRLRYHMNSILAIPIAATPAAEPIMIILPPVPVVKANNTQKE